MSLISDSKIVHLFYSRLPFSVCVGLLFSIPMLVVDGKSSRGDTVSVAGSETWMTGDPTTDTLSGGFRGIGLTWEHSYTPIDVASITGAFLTMDIIDADNGSLDLYAGTSVGGTFIGSVFGNDNGNPGFWRPLGDPFAPETTLTIDSSLYADLADGTFTIFGDNIGLGQWGSNRARLTIVTAIPEPTSLVVISLLLLPLGRRRKSPVN